jgi:hypothetical protein
LDVRRALLVNRLCNANKNALERAKNSAGMNLTGSKVSQAITAFG